MMKSFSEVVMSICLVIVDVAVGLSCDQIYPAKPGDTLSSLASQFYGDEQKWTLIKQANPGNPSLSENSKLIDMQIYIPCKNASNQLQALTTDNGVADSLLDQLLTDGITSKNTRPAMKTQSTDTPKEAEAIRSLAAISEDSASLLEELLGEDIVKKDPPMEAKLRIVPVESEQDNSLHDNVITGIDTKASDASIENDDDSRAAVYVRDKGINDAAQASVDTAGYNTDKKSRIMETSRTGEQVNTNVESDNFMPEPDNSADAVRYDKMKNISSVSSAKMTEKEVKLAAIASQEIERLKNDLSAIQSQAELEIETMKSRMEELAQELEETRGADLDSGLENQQQPMSDLGQEQVMEDQVFTQTDQFTQQQLTEEETVQQAQTRIASIQPADFDSDELESQPADVQRSANETLMSMLRIRLIETIASLKSELSAARDANSQEAEDIRAEIEKLESIFEEIETIAAEELEKEKSKVEQLEAQLNSTVKDNTSSDPGRNGNSAEKTPGKLAQKKVNSYTACDKFPNLCKYLESK